MVQPENILDIGYVITKEGGAYVLAHAGLYRTKKGAQKECDYLNKFRAKKIYQVVKVNLVIVEEEND